MIKIISHGTRQRITCSECGCYFSYDAEDVETTTNNVTKATKKTIRCPQCKTLLDVTSNGAR